jgi:hypothetical protein
LAEYYNNSYLVMTALEGVTEANYGLGVAVENTTK